MNTAIGLAADLQLAAAIPIARYVEYLTPCVYMEDLTCVPFVIDKDGFWKSRPRPGLGVTLDAEKLAQVQPVGETDNVRDEGLLISRNALATGFFAGLRNQSGKNRGLTPCG